MQQRELRRMNAQPHSGLAWIGLFVIALTLTGCGRHRRIEVIDLDRVLTILDTVMKTPIEGGTAATNTEGTDEKPTDKPTDAKTEVESIDPSNQPAALTNAFLNRFHSELNKAKLMSQPIGVLFEQSGAILGFTDVKGDQKKNSGDRSLFRIEIDADGQRVIASDLQRPQYRRDRHYGSYYHGYGYHGGNGFFMGYMLGSMRGRSNHYYSNPTRTRPNYRGMSMVSQGYQRSALRSAQTKARARSRSSARSRGGSFSFRGGK